MAEERSELEDMLRETYKTEKQQEKKPEEKKKPKMEYSRTVEQLQKLWHMGNGKTRRRRKRET